SAVLRLRVQRPQFARHSFVLALALSSPLPINLLQRNSPTKPKKNFCCTLETVFHSCMKHVIVPARQTKHQMVWARKGAPLRSRVKLRGKKRRRRKMNTKATRPKVNPLSRRPRQQRLVLAVRGGAGVGKSYFVRSMAEAGIGRLCIFDVERKSRRLKGNGTIFDGLEIEHPDEVPEFIDWP